MNSHAPGGPPRQASGAAAHGRNGHGGHGHGEHGLRGWLVHLGHRLIAAACVASVVMLTTALWRPLQDLFNVIAASAEGVVSPPEQGLARWTTADAAIIKIDEGRHQSADHYAGHSPLDRCHLAGDLRQLLALPGVQTVGVDLDLSPALPLPLGVDAETLRTVQTHEQACQIELDKLVDAHRCRLVLMAPTIPATGPLRGIVQEWVKTREQQGAVFGHVRVKTEHGLVQSFDPAVQDDSGKDGTGTSRAALGMLLGERLTQPMAPDCAPPAAASASASGASAPAGDAHATHAQPHLIAYHALARFHAQGQALTLDDPCLQATGRPAHCPTLRLLVVGSGYSEDDRFDTPIGRLDGVDIHAAIAACSKVQASHLTHLLLDILVGALVFAPVLEYFWRRYYQTRLGLRAAQLAPSRPGGLAARAWRRIRTLLTPTHPHAAYLWLLIMLPVAVALGILVMLAFVHIGSGPCAVATAPAGLLVGMLIDAAVVTGQEVSQEHLAELQQQLDQARRDAGLPVPAEPTVPPPPSYWTRVHQAVLWLGFAALLALAVTYARHQWTYLGLLDAVITLASPDTPSQAAPSSHPGAHAP